MRKMRILLLTIMLLCVCVGTAFSEENQNINFQKSQSYELADIFNIFAPPSIMGSEMDWIGIRYAENFKNLYKTKNVPKPKNQFVFGGYVGLLFNNSGHKSSTHYWEDGILKDNITENGYTAILSFYCPVWNGYNHLNVGINLPPNKVSYSHEQNSA